MHDEPVSGYPEPDFSDTLAKLRRDAEEQLAPDLLEDLRAVSKKLPSLAVAMRKAVGAVREGDSRIRRYGIRVDKFGEEDGSATVVVEVFSKMDHESARRLSSMLNMVRETWESKLKLPDYSSVVIVHWL